MNKTGIRESFEMFEMLRDSACMIDHFTDYINHCQDPELRQMLERQQRTMVDQYQQTISIMQGHGLDLSNMPRFQSSVHGQGQSHLAGSGMPGGSSSMYEGTSLQYGMQQQVMMQSNPQNRNMQQQYQRYPGSLSDQTISQGALLFHKCGSTRATTVALESAEPHLRELAAKSARNCMDMAYELYRYMEQKRYYQLPNLPSNFINHLHGTQAQMNQGMNQGFSGGHGHNSQGH